MLQKSVDFAFLDSGIGGLPYMTYLRTKYPGSSCVYLADTKNFPYGTKSQEEIISNATAATSLLIGNFNPKTIVIACNTMSVVALESLRSTFSVPFVGTVPAIKQAASVTKNGKIGLLATDRTISDKYTLKLIDDFAHDVQVFSLGEPTLIDFIEKQFFCATTKERRDAVQPSIKYFKECDVDTIVLACTHFTNMIDDFIAVAGENIQIIDSRDGVARRAISLRNSVCSELVSDQLRSSDSELTCPIFVTSGDSEKNYRIFAKKLHIPWGGLL